MLAIRHYIPFYIYIYLFLFYIDFTIEKQDCEMDHIPSLPIIFFFSSK